MSQPCSTSEVRLLIPPELYHAVRPIVDAYTQGTAMCPRIVSGRSPHSALSRDMCLAISVSGTESWQRIDEMLHMIHQRWGDAVMTVEAITPS